MSLIKEEYRALYRTLGRQLEIKRFRLSKMTDKTLQDPFLGHRISKKDIEDEIKDILLRLSELEDVLY